MIYGRPYQKVRAQCCGAPVRIRNNFPHPSKKRSVRCLRFRLAFLLHHLTLSPDDSEDRIFKRLRKHGTISYPVAARFVIYHSREETSRSVSLHCALAEERRSTGKMNDIITG
ncbi:hypothetical protein Trydic_g972 [Trypoxylus dichotomus]